jgi:lipoyl(octanoyl) transferase
MKSGAMATKCRLLSHLVSDGPSNMALDEALLDEVARAGDTAYLRTYEWTKPTLSLGYFQRIADVETDPRWSSVPVVRRATGGGALWHHHEITYAVVIPSVHPLSRPNRRLYQAVHGAIAGLLTENGAKAMRYGDHGGPGTGRKEHPFLCFTDRDAEDIMVYNCKVVGSAQRRRDGAILQHGSVLFARSAHVPEIRGVCDVADIASVQEGWAALILGQLERALNFDAEPGEIPSFALERAADYEVTRYRNRAWTSMR